MMEVIGMRTLHTNMQVFIFLSWDSSQSWFFGATITAEFETLVPLFFVFTIFELINSFTAKTMKTTIGMTRPWSNQISISFRPESSGNSAWTELYKVYMTKFDVRETIIIASKCVSFMKRATSAATMRQIEGMKRENQNGPDRLWSWTTRYIPLLCFSVVQFVTTYLLRVWAMCLSSSPHLVKWNCFFWVAGTPSCVRG